MDSTGSIEDDIVVFDPTEPGFFQNPYPQYARLRDHDPVHLSPFGVAVVTRYHDVQTVLRDPRLTADDKKVRNNPRLELLNATGVDVTPNNTMVRLDPPEHTRLRGFTQEAFTPKAVATLRPFLEGLLTSMLDEAADKGRIDFVLDIARPFTVQAVLTILGIRQEDHKLFRDQVDAIAVSNDFFLTPEAAQTAADAMRRLIDYFETLIEEKRRKPTDDIFSEMVHACEQGGQLTQDELIRTAILLFSAGHETTMNFLSIALLALLRHPDQRQLLVDAGVAESRAVQELLRYDNSVHLTGRATTDHYELGGVAIEPDTTIVVVLGSANRDPRFWGPTADQLDLTRPNSREHLSMGFGTHFCLGSRLGWLESELVLPGILRRFRNVELVESDPPVWGDRLFTRDVHRLPLDVYT